MQKCDRVPHEAYLGEAASLNSDRGSIERALQRLGHP